MRPAVGSRHLVKGTNKLAGGAHPPACRPALLFARVWGRIGVAVMVAVAFVFCVSAGWHGHGNGRVLGVACL